MTKPIRITVTAEHIKRGVKDDSFLCPIALAMIEVIGAEEHERVNNGACLPASVLKFVKRFDSGKPVKPFSFLLRRKS